MKIIDETRLDELNAAGSASPRRRANDNLHEAFDDPVQRFLNGLEPGSYVRPHLHPEPWRWEYFQILRGSVAVFTFDNDGQVNQRIDLSTDGPVFGCEIPAQTWHTAVALVPGSVVFELKQGPYDPQSAKHFAPFSPAEDAERHLLDQVVHWLESARVGDVMAFGES